MKLSPLKEILSGLLNSKLFWLQACAIGIWLLVIQNYFGWGKTNQRVYVTGGRINADVTGSVDAYVTGAVDINNTVSVEVENTVRTWSW